MNKKKYTLLEYLNLVLNFTKFSVETLPFFSIVYFVLIKYTIIANELHIWFPITWATAVIVSMLYHLAKDTYV